jgi:hypothetical protein
VTTICKATSPEQLREVRNLMRAFIEWHRQRHRAELDRVDRYFDPVLFEAELNSLPGELLHRKVGSCSLVSTVDLPVVSPCAISAPMSAK